MKEWIVFGCGKYLSNIFDIIHACEGRVKAIIKNIDLSVEQRNDLTKRISFLDYIAPIIELQDFTPTPGENYTVGFLTNRDKLILSLKKSLHLSFSSLIHPTSCICSNVKLGEGVIVNPMVVIAPNTKIGDFCTINRASAIGHDVILKDFCTIAPMCAIAGKVVIGEKTTIAIGATIIDEIKIGANSFIGAGSLVTKDMPKNVLAYGVPAKVIKTND